MIQPIYQNGLLVDTISPESGSLGSSVYSLIQLTFNSDLNTASIVNNIAVFEDTLGKYISIDSIKENHASFTKVDGTYSYKDKVVTFTPASPLKNSVKYIVAVRYGGITDIYGNAMAKEQCFHFVTESDDIEPKVSILQPTPGMVLATLSEMSWTNVNSEMYFVEVSRQQTFETTVYAETVRKNVSTGKTPSSILLSVDLDNGMYYIRARALKGLWSEPVQIFVKKVTDALVSEEDLSDIIHELNIDDRPLNLIEMYPENGASNVSLGLNICYFKFEGYVDYDDLDIFGSTVERMPIDDVSEIPEDILGEWTHIYDSKDNVTYFIFKIDN